MKKWKCLVCNYVHTGDSPPEPCPVCGAPASKFVLVEDEAAEDPSPAPEPGATETPTQQAAPEKKKAAAAQTFFDKTTRLMVRHHAHPVTVHLPNGVIPVAVALFIISWVYGAPLLVKAGFINLVFVIISLPLVLFSGFQEWKKKYNMARTNMFKIKILAAAVTTVACITSIIWYLMDPGVLASSKAWAFILINIVMLGAAGVAGHIGGKLVFKD